jgi:predicted transcriptional regulator
MGLAGAPPSDVQEQIKFLAEQRMRERQVTYGQALADIGREQPDLMQQYRRAVSSD